MQYIIEYKPQRGKPIHISRVHDWRARGRRHPNGWRVIGIAGSTRDAVAVAERYCQHHLAVDLRRVLLQKATLSPAEKRLVRQLDRRVQAFQDRAKTRG